MPDIVVTPDQRERLRWIQRRLEEDVAYGHVRPCDALDYLLDHAEATDGLAEIGADGTVSDRASPGEDGYGTQTAAGEGSTVTNALDGDVESTNGVASGASEDTPTETGSAGSASDAADADTTGGDDPKSSAANGETTLNSMMQLLETHDDKWREASVGDEKYEVDLPDGSTEPARTKDDVRALLFKHHR